MEYAFSSSRDQLQSTLFTLTHTADNSHSIVTVRATKIAPTPLLQAQNSTHPLY